MFLSDTGAQGMRALRRIPDRTAWIGLASGAAFGVSGVCYRGASLSLEQGDTAIRAAMTLACVTAAQTIAMTLWFLLRDKPQISRVLKSWRVSGLVGITSMIGSFFWFSAFTLQQAAYVNAVGQIELVFSILASTVFFGETIKRQEWIGMSFLGLSIFIIAAGI
jgi:drug/metabolite transporter (DMT)-like permease